jgi:hypothetical protein
MADWIHAGGTAAIAQVDEPGANLCNMTNESSLFDMLLRGFTWAEAAWSATPQVSFVNTVIGDPLMTWRPWLPGDANLDGIVNGSDLLKLTLNLGKPGTFSTGDFNGDGIVDTGDLALLSTHFGQSAAVATVSAAALFGSDQSGLVPEPLAWISLAFTLPFCLASRRRRDDLNLAHS